MWAAAGGAHASTCTIPDYRHLARLFVTIAETTRHCAQSMDTDDAAQHVTCRRCHAAVDAGDAFRQWIAAKPQCFDSYYQPVLRTSAQLARDVRTICAQTR